MAPPRDALRGPTALAPLTELAPTRRPLGQRVRATVESWGRPYHSSGRAACAGVLALLQLGCAARAGAQSHSWPVHSPLDTLAFVDAYRDKRPMFEGDWRVGLMALASSSRANTGLAVLVPASFAFRGRLCVDVVSTDRRYVAHAEYDATLLKPGVARLHFPATHREPFALGRTDKVLVMARVQPDCNTFRGEALAAIWIPQGLQAVAVPDSLTLLLNLDSRETSLVSVDVPDTVACARVISDDNATALTHRCQFVPPSARIVTYRARRRGPGLTEISAPIRLIAP